MSTRFLRLFLSTLVLVLISSGIQAGTYHSGDKKKEKKEKLSGDGPYILYQADGSTRVINVNKKGRITDKTYATLPKDFSFRVTDHEGRYPFDVKLHPLKRPEWQYTRPEKVFVVYLKRLEKMQIFVDADACPVVDIVETIAEKYNIKTTLLCDTNHVLYSDYSEVIVVGAGADAVDYKLISLCHRGDIVVSQDYGVAAMALGKAAYAIHQSGRWYTDENIDRMLMERHLNKKARRSSHKNHIKGPKKRTEEDDERFAQSFEKMILMAKSKEELRNTER